MFSLKDMWLRPSSGRNDQPKHRQGLWQPLVTIVVAIIVLAVLSGFAWALIEFIREKTG